MTRTDVDEVALLRSSMRGTALVPGDAEYDDARRLWNAEVDMRPAVIARCASSGDVSAAVAFAVDRGLEIAVRGGAHAPSGYATVDDGMMIDLSLLHGVSIDVAGRRARVGGGALLADVINAAQEHGLAYPVGAVAHTGVGGLTLGGGMGWLTRKHGLSIDNLLSAEVVTADARVLRASAEDNVDLFWALRGGGGNFGVVTEFEFALHPVGPLVQVGLSFWGLEQGREFFAKAREVVASLPPEVNVILGGVNAPPAPFVPPEHQLQPGYLAVVVGFGPVAEHDDVMARLGELPPLWSVSTPMPYAGLQQMLDEENAWGQYAYDKSVYLDELTDDVIDVIAEHIPRKPSPSSVTLFYRLDGAFSAVGEQDTAFSGARSAGFAAFIIGLCATADGLPTARQWVRDFHAALAPHSRAGAYVNTVIEDDDAAVRAAYGPEKYERLTRIKRRYDPDNVFHRNANIRPALGPPEQRKGD